MRADVKNTGDEEEVIKEGIKNKNNILRIGK
jgi:hypothetical protein